MKLTNKNITGNVVDQGFLLRLKMAYIIVMLHGAKLLAVPQFSHL